MDEVKTDESQKNAAGTHPVQRQVIHHITSGLSWWQRQKNYLFGIDYVVLKLHSGDHLVKRMYRLGDQIYAEPHGQNTRCQLLPGGAIKGQIYVMYWYPVTPRSYVIYNNGRGV